MGHSLDVLTPLDKQLANSQKNNHFGINFLSTYMGNNEELRFSDFIKEEFCLEKDKSQVKSLGRQSWVLSNYYSWSNKTRVSKLLS